MTTLTHGSDLTLAPEIRPVANATDGTVRTALGRLVAAGFRSMQLDLTFPGLRPRELDRRARRDLLARLTRSGVTLAGADLFIPKRHFAETENLDRAMAAALAADLGRVPLSLALPLNAMNHRAKQTLVECGKRRGVAATKWPGWPARIAGPFRRLLPYCPARARI